MWPSGNWRLVSTCTLRVKEVLQALHCLTHRGLDTCIAVACWYGKLSREKTTNFNHICKQPVANQKSLQYVFKRNYHFFNNTYVTIAARVLNVSSFSVAEGMSSDSITWGMTTRNHFKRKQHMLLIGNNSLSRWSPALCNDLTLGTSVYTWSYHVAKTSNKREKEAE